MALFVGRIEGATLASGQCHSVVLDPSTHSVWTWGCNTFGQLGLGTAAQDHVLPERVSGLGPVQAVAAGDTHTLALRADGAVLVWGAGAAYATPARVIGLPAMAGVAAGGAHALAWTHDGALWSWRADQRAALRSTAWLGHDIVAAAINDTHGVALSSDGRVWRWKAAAGPRSATLLQAAAPAGDAGVSAVTVRGTAILARRSNGSLLEWAFDSDETPPPALVSDVDGVLGVVAGAQHAAAWRTDGTVRTWGVNDLGQLGDPRAFSTRAATPSALVHIVEVAAGASHNLALARDGSVWAWGDNHAGQLGDGTHEVRPTPVKIAEAGYD